MRLDRAERHARGGCDLGVTHAFGVREQHAQTFRGTQSCQRRVEIEPQAVIDIRAAHGWRFIILIEGLDEQLRTPGMLQPDVHGDLAEPRAKGARVAKS